MPLTTWTAADGCSKKCLYLAHIHSLTLQVLLNARIPTSFACMARIPPFLCTTTHASLIHIELNAHFAACIQCYKRNSCIYCSSLSAATRLAHTSTTNPLRCPMLKPASVTVLLAPLTARTLAVGAVVAQADWESAQAQAPQTQSDHGAPQTMMMPHLCDWEHGRCDLGV